MSLHYIEALGEKELLDEEALLLLKRHYSMDYGPEFWISLLPTTRSMCIRVIREGRISSEPDFEPGDDQE